MNLPKQPPNWSIALVLIIGVLAVSTSSILIRLANSEAGAGGFGFSLVLAASRLTLSALILLPAWPKIQWNALQPGARRYAAAAGLCLALHFALWITSLSYTSIAASTALVTTNPVWVALLSRFWFGEKLSKMSIAGITIALAGGMAIAVGVRAQPMLAAANCLAISLLWLVPGPSACICCWGGKLSGGDWELAAISRSPILLLRSSCCLSPSSSAPVIPIIRTLYIFIFC